ncbi:helix-turn-helix domain-containing protein [Candidatus Peribacteria bacterium]|nr:helix-turn-helix domain-containing protein [Candidatus Peribacteria bacterium]
MKLITDTLWRINTIEDLSGVLTDLLTPAEITEVADRIRLLKMLQEGKTQRAIAEELAISVTTVSRGNRILQYEDNTISKYL